jgi:hypothetical protein
MLQGRPVRVCNLNTWIIEYVCTRRICFTEQNKANLTLHRSFLQKHCTRRYFIEDRCFIVKASSSVREEGGKSVSKPYATLNEIRSPLRHKNILLLMYLETPCMSSVVCMGQNGMNMITNWPRKTLKTAERMTGNLVEIM